MKTRTLWLNVILLLALLLPGAGHPMAAAMPETEATDVSQVMWSSEIAEGLSIFTSQAEEPEWSWQNPLPQGNSLYDVWGSGSNDIFAVGMQGTILHYDGIEWTKMSSGTTAWLRGVWGSSSSNIIAAGHTGYPESNGVVLHYDGNSWSEMDIGTTAMMFGVWGSSENNIFLVGANGTVLHYDGNEWTSINSGTTRTLYGVWGNSTTDIFIVGSIGTILHYDGSLWHEMDSNTEVYLVDVWGSDTGDVFAVGNDGVILHYDGNTWESMTSNTVYGCSAVWGTSNSNVFAACGSDVIMHYDGSKWLAMGINTTTYVSLRGVWGSGPNDVFAVGSNGAIVHYNGSSWSSMTTGMTGMGYYFLRGLWGSSDSNVYAVGDQGAILHYNGSVWSGMYSGTDTNLAEVWGSGPNDIYVVGGKYQESILLHYDGSSWTVMHITTTSQLYGVWGTGSDNIYAVGSGGTILHFDGSQWSTMTSNTTAWLYDVWGTGPDDVYAVGHSEEAVILHYDGSGWGEVFVYPYEHLSAVWGNGPDDVFAVGGAWESFVLHYDGNSWQEIEVNTDPLFGVWGSGPSDVFAVGNNGTILHYDGTVWRKMNSGATSSLCDVWGSGPNDVFAVGNGGTILHYGRDPEGTINGRVSSTIGDTGLSDVVVAARTYSTTTDLNGDYTLVVSPGVYSVKATPNAGMDYYANQRSFITVDDGETVTVDLKLTPITSDTVDTLILANLQRMKDIGFDGTTVDELEAKLSELKATHPDRTNMTAAFVDFGAGVSPDIDAAYAAWDGNEGDVLKTNALVDSIDAYIENLKLNDYPNLKYLIIVGSHEVIPMKARAADSGEENEWAEGEGHLPVQSGYLYEIYRSQEGGARGHYLTDSQYGDLSFIGDGDTRGCDGELIPELYVGRLVETPEQITGLVDAYLSSQGMLSREKMVSIASVDLLDSGAVAAEYMGPTADDDLVQLCFPSNSVVEKMETGPDIVYLAGHSDYHRTGTCKSGGDWSQVFHAGPSATQGSVRDISIELPNTVIVSVGCHNGLNLGNQLYQAPDGESQWSDFPEEFAEKKVGVFFASTGYARGSMSGNKRSPHTVSSSEKLATNILYFLLQGNGASAGEAFKEAINSFVVHNETCGDEQNRVLAIATLYGIPNYRLLSASNAVAMNGDMQLITTAAASVSAKDSWSIKVEIPSWALDDSGVVTVLGASYMENINTPILPVISFKRLLPAGSTVASVTWNQDESVNLTMTNDIPLPVIGMPTLGAGESVTVTGTFTHTGEYPAVPYFVNEISDAGGGQWINVQVVPVQYNQTTHTTRVWTHLSFDVEYDVAASIDSDGDGLPDYWEKAYGLDPMNDSGDNGPDGDIDGDGLSNIAEYHYNTNPRKADTDDDGSPDRIEILLGTDPNNPFSRAKIIFLPLVTRS